MIVTDANLLKPDRLLAIGNSPALGDYLRHRYPDCAVDKARSVLDGIYQLAQHPFRAVLAYLDPDDPRLRDAIAGLREAAGARARVLLCCKPEAEPDIRAALDAGADDYLLWPLEGGEIDRAIGFVTDDVPDSTPPPPAALEELALLNHLLAGLDAEPFTILNQLADLARVALGAAAVTLVVDGSVANSGATVVEPVLTEPIVRAGRTVGRINVGSRAAPYSAADLAKLRHYAILAANLLTAAQNQRDWRKQAFTDEVSKLHNRRYVLQFLKTLLERARAERFRVTVLLFDIDNFKSYNDTYGHAAGDEIICRIGQLFQGHCREHDIVARYGGDEFCVVFWDADQPRVAGSAHPADALIVLDRFRQALRTCHCASLGAETRGQLTISGGLASYPWDAATASELIERADQALLRAKQAGKNQVFVFGDDACHLPPPAP